MPKYNDFELDIQNTNNLIEHNDAASGSTPCTIVIITIGISDRYCDQIFN